VKLEQPMLALLDEKQKVIFSALESAGEPLVIDKLCELTKMDVSEMNRRLTLLLLQGIIKEKGDRYYL
jgi:DNA-binding IclR family transcriptional regulator